MHENVSATNIKVHRNVPATNCRCMKSSQPQILCAQNCAPPLLNSMHLMCWWLDSFSCTYCAGRKTGGLNPLWWGRKWCCYDLWSICGRQEIRLPNSSYNSPWWSFQIQFTSKQCYSEYKRIMIITLYKGVSYVDNFYLFLLYPL